MSDLGLPFGGLPTRRQEPETPVHGIAQFTRPAVEEQTPADQTLLPPLVYLPIAIVGLILVVYVPTDRVLHRLMPAADQTDPAS